MEVFDAPDALVSCPRRESSTHAPQALELLNGTFANQQADALATRLETEAGPDLRKQIDLATAWSPAGRPGRRKCRRRWSFSQTQPQAGVRAGHVQPELHFLYVN